MTQWNHYNPVNVQSAPGILDRLNEFAGPDGPWLLITTAGFTRRGITEKVLALLGRDRVVVFDEVSPNPELDHLEAATQRLRTHGFAGIVALGGGSALDAAKVLAVTLASSLERPLHTTLREGNSQQWSSGIPLIAIPTTAGTGAEVTPFATVWDSTVNKKHSVTGELLFPKHALLDPELTQSLPGEITLSTGLDTLSHALESLWNRNRTAVSEAHSTQALRLANEALPAILDTPDDLEQRGKMQQASMLAGLAISHTRTAIAHSISYPMTLHYGIPHGLACSFTLPAIIERYLDSAGAGDETRLIKSTERLLEGLKLKDRVNAYIGNGDPLKHLDEMFHPDRAGNYSGSLDKASVQSIIASSLHQVSSN